VYSFILLFDSLIIFVFEVDLHEVIEIITIAIRQYFVDYCELLYIYICTILDIHFTTLQIVSISC
jgi:hypothetical protein